MSSEGSPLGAVIRAYNERYGAMDAAMWCLSLHCRAPLVEQRNSRVIEALVDTIKDWWGVSYVPDGTSVVMARRLATLGFSREMFAEGPIVSGAERYATHQVLTLVERTFEEAPIGFDGRRRREFSLASKVLHWLLPWRIPAYDSFVRKAVHVSDEDGATAYPNVARRVIARARHAERPISKEWIGLYAPDSPLRAVDKQLWWYGGGNKGTARVVHNPWAVIDHLGLDRLGLDRISTARQLQGG